MIKVVKTELLAAVFANEIVNTVNKAAEQKVKISIALSGGSTPKAVFKVLASLDKSEKIDWTYTHFYWGDERCVAPDDPESNYGEADKLLFVNISIPPDNIHRIYGENDPQEEALRYAEEIKNNIAIDNSGIPVFDWVILGLGTDGHTASIFHAMELSIEKNNICGVAIHPVTGQKRISLTFNVINNAKRISFLAAGIDKAKVIDEIINRKPQSSSYPAAKIFSSKNEVEWFIDFKAAEFID